MARKSNFAAGGGEAAVAELLRKRFAAANQVTGDKPFNINSISPAQRAAARKTIEERGRLENNRIEAAARNPKRFRYSNNKIYYDGAYVGDMVGGKPVYKDGFTPGSKTDLKIDNTEKPKLTGDKKEETLLQLASDKNKNREDGGSGGGGGSRPIPRTPQPEESQPTPAQPEATKPQPKPIPKADSNPSTGYVKSKEGYYRGTNEASAKKYQEDLAKKNNGSSSGNPLLDRFRRDMGRDAKTGERQYSTPDEKSKYVDKDGKLKTQNKPTAAGTKPVNNAEPVKPPTPKTGGNTPLKASRPMEGGTPLNERGVFETLAERRRRKRLEGGGSSYT